MTDEKIELKAKIEDEKMHVLTYSLYQENQRLRQLVNQYEDGREMLENDHTLLNSKSR